MPPNDALNRLLACGSRDWDDFELIHAVLAGLRSSHAQVLIHGAAKGADRLAGTEALKLGFEVQEFPAAWRENGRYNPGAGLERNLEMLDQKPDLVVAFQRNRSRGTQHTIDNALRRDIPVTVVNV